MGTPRETLVFRNIRIVYPLDLFFPLTAVKNNAVLGVSQVTSGSVLASGSAVSKMCRINANTHSLIQFNGKTIALPEKVTNGHSLMVAHDASTYRRFMVLVTPITSQNLLKTHILLKQNEIEIIPSSSSPIVTVNSKKIELLLLPDATAIPLRPRFGFFHQGNLRVDLQLHTQPTHRKPPSYEEQDTR